MVGDFQSNDSEVEDRAATCAQAPNHPSRRCYSISETTAILGIGKGSVFTLLRTGRLRKIKILGRTLITTAEIGRFIAELEVASEAEIKP